MAFHNRALELETLRTAIQSSKSQLFILYGRRGVGKSSLLSQAVADYKHIFYRATRQTLPLQLENLTLMVRDAYPEEFISGDFTSFESFLEFLSHLADQREDEQVIVVIDELPYITDVSPGFLTTLQHWWDKSKNRPNLKLLLAGSYVAFMESQVLDANAPLYNRRTGAMKVDPLMYDEAALFFPSYSTRERIETFAILGGMPSYLEQFDPFRSWSENLLDTALRRSTYLHDEPDWLLRQELRRDVTHGSILRAIATGCRKPSDIARAIGKPSASDVTLQLRTLQDLQLVRREVPITERNRPTARTSQYWLSDNYLNFWYRYVDPARSFIAQGRGDRALERIKESFDEYVSRPPFEEICRRFAMRSLAERRLPTGLFFDSVGTWWDASREIDVVAQEGGRTTFVGSCKWTTTKIGFKELNKLQADLAGAAKDLHPHGTPWYGLFSREGFEKNLLEYASDPNNRVLLFRPEDLFIDGDAP